MYALIELLEQKNTSLQVNLYQEKQNFFSDKISYHSVQR